MTHTILSVSQTASKRSAIQVGRLPALVFMIGTALASANCLMGQDWPQINGPTRNGIADQEKLLSEWPDGKPKTVWTHPVGQGFAGPVVKDNRLIIFHRPAASYLVEALAADTGAPIWNKQLPSIYEGGGPDRDRGPKAVPLIQDNKVYLLGTGGNLFCLSMADGSIVWQKNVLKIYKSPLGYFGAGSSPIVVDDQLLLNVGGQKAGVVAFDLESGEEVWKSFDDRASYSSPIAIESNGRTIAVFVTRMNLVGVDPADGSVVFKTPFGKRGPTVNGAMPVFHENHLFINSAYGVGARWFELIDTQIREVWSNDDSFSSQYSTPVMMDGYLYGTAGREDFGNGSFRCVEAATGKIMWKQEDVAVGHTLLVDNRLLLLESSGTLSLIEPSIKKFKRLSAANLFLDSSRSIPAFSNGRLYARSNADSKPGRLSCFQLGESN